MTPDPLFFRDLAYVVGAAMLGGLVARLARQPLVLGYVFGGILVGPFTPGPVVSDVHTFELFAEIGVILLMFSIGIEFSFKDLLQVKWVAMAGGPLGILLSIGLAVGVGSLIGWSPLKSTVIGAVISVASTMVLARLLLDRGELQSRHGRVMIGITLVEDLAVVALTVLLPALGSFEPGRLILIGQALIKAVLILVPFGYLAAKVVPRLMTRVARTQNQELFLLVALTIGIGTAALTQMVGLSLALGAFLAGLIISGSDYGHETLARLLPLRDVFVALFFVTIGILIDPGVILANVPLLGAMIGLIIVGKFVIWSAVVLLFRYRLATAFLVAVGLTQIGEFSFVLVQVARTAGHVGEEVYNATLAASLLTILLNAPLVRYAPSLIGRLDSSSEPSPQRPAAGESDLREHAVVCGYGRLGKEVEAALRAFEIPTLVIERDPDVVHDLRGKEVRCLYGDGSQREPLDRAAVDHAALIVVAWPDIESVRLSVSRARALNPKAPIFALAHRHAEAKHLMQIGATVVVQPEVEAAASLIGHALSRLAVPKERIGRYLEQVREKM